jgi:hypothetical protein
MRRGGHYALFSCARPSSPIHRGRGLHLRDLGVRRKLVELVELDELLQFVEFVDQLG